MPNKTEFHIMNSIPDHRFLTPGEIIKEGDERLTFYRKRGGGGWTSFGVWAPVDRLIGKTNYYPNQIRRPVTPVTRRDVAQ